MIIQHNYSSIILPNPVENNPIVEEEPKVEIKKNKKSKVEKTEEE